jgi:hypothetical protein
VTPRTSPTNSLQYCTLYSAASRCFARAPPRSPSSGWHRARRMWSDRPSPPRTPSSAIRSATSSSPGASPQDRVDLAARPPGRAPLGHGRAGHRRQRGALRRRLLRLAHPSVADPPPHLHRLRRHRHHRREAAASETPMLAALSMTRTTASATPTPPRTGTTLHGVHSVQCALLEFRLDRCFVFFTILGKFHSPGVG